MTLGTALIVLAAGQGSRMLSGLPKVLHEVGAQPLLAHALGAGAALDPERVVVVTGHGAARVEAAVGAIAPGAVTVRQDRQLGTGHAVAQARPALADFGGDAVVLYGDTPFIAPQTLRRMAEARAAGNDVVVLGFEAREPGRYGRLITDGDRLDRIVEFKDATETERAVRLCNSGVVMARAATLFDLVAAVGNDNAAGEYYLTDIVQIANARGLRCGAVTCDEAETLGINTRAELAGAEAVFQARRRAEVMAAGVTLVAPDTVFLAADTVFGRDVVVEPNVVFGPGVRVAEGARIRAFSHLEGAQVGAGAVAGPYARLRPGTRLGAGARIGNFVETKNAALGDGVKVNHLSYVGDAEIGAGTNIGAGTITCNYDGVLKHRTVVGTEAFIGSNTMLVAPVSVGDRAMTASGSVITADVPAEALALARARQQNKPGLAVKLRARLLAIKAGLARKAE
ncbi:bifunctional UDP-N-acetylglucosamine diphosphorylase/glucosamine-1-phosphate N-acetyltransferase GlmU [Meridianimarinicoccus roseus]|uniref:Bifunctional protein GlmU n=1 Tax=Meridianimarinicoccus roseus TaxID=2072018 RepID=A0A2V2LJY0_9RHOB|nr:bifunctional UDP-N-acetylglucosamine diphosphorylase/glucosamine-1-phosphate N-acetyltransferase GlmU [Meridianimarinicoccus roseus]PWR02143.1 bifunctional UDP-N-acetylglucosamine diphosphorylase/glucosamine-1-phosphate N-acetyltransferase GlmU [Meridianimarinicoccus roseus]